MRAVCTILFSMFLLCVFERSHDRPLRNTLNRLQGNVESILTWLPHICFIARTINAGIRVCCVFENAARPDLSLRFFFGGRPPFLPTSKTH